MKEIEFTNSPSQPDTISDQEMPIVGDRDVQVETDSNHGRMINQLGSQVLRYGLVLVIAWIGAMKFTAYEANGIQPLVANSPLMSWAYSIFSVTTLAALLGTMELMIATMIAISPISKRIGAIGSSLAILLFATTLSFLFSTPGWEPTLGGFPALSIVPGQFLIKDVVLLGAAIWSLGDTLKQ